MSNPKIVVLNGLERGGTGVVWNILQSHPDLCSPILETGEVLFGSHLNLVPTRFLRWAFLRSGVTDVAFIDKVIYKYFDYLLNHGKNKNYNHIQNGTRYENIFYTKNEVKQSSICLKSVNYDLILTDFFRRHYKVSHFIGLVRNGYAVCNGWMRRGYSAKEAGRIYSDIVNKMIDFNNNYNNYMLLKFEDAINDPFGIAKELYTFADLSPVTLEKLRLKSTKTISNTGSHKAQYGKEDSKYWFDSDQIFSILDSDINSKQLRLLKEKDRFDFQKEAGEVLEFFQYDYL